MEAELHGGRGGWRQHNNQLQILKRRTRTSARNNLAARKKRVMTREGDGGQRAEEEGAGRRTTTTSRRRRLRAAERPTREEEVVDRERRRHTRAGATIHTTIKTIRMKDNTFEGRGCARTAVRRDALLSRQDLGFQILHGSRPCLRFVRTSTRPAAPASHPSPWGACYEKISAAGADRCAAVKEYFTIT